MMQTETDIVPFILSTFKESLLTLNTPWNCSCQCSLFRVWDSIGDQITLSLQQSMMENCPDLNSPVLPKSQRYGLLGFGNARLLL